MSVKNREGLSYTTRTIDERTAVDSLEYRYGWPNKMENRTTVPRYKRGIDDVTNISKIEAT